jgi:hypothetical protein
MNFWHIRICQRGECTQSKTKTFLPAKKTENMGCRLCWDSAWQRWRSCREDARPVHRPSCISGQNTHRWVFSAPAPPQYQRNFHGRVSIDYKAGQFRQGTLLAKKTKNMGCRLCWDSAGQRWRSCREDVRPIPRPSCISGHNTSR